MLDINPSEVGHTAEVTIPPLIEGGGGGFIVHTCSATGIKAHESVAHYASAEHAVVGIMRTPANELAPQVIRVNSMHPIQVDTPTTINDDTYRLFRPDLANTMRECFEPASQAINALPVPWVEARNSSALLFLASDEARYATGLALPIDTGCVVKESDK